VIVAFPAVAALIALACAGVVGWDALKRPRPERVIWFVAFLVFAVAAAAEVTGAMLGWSPVLARVYYLSGAVLVVGVLALGEAYLLWPARMPSFAPGIALLVVAIAATVVWSAPVDPARLADEGWHALERGPVLVALAVAINAGGTLVLVGGALYSAVRLRAAASSQRRAVGCVLIAAGAIFVALGGTMTRLGRPEYLYLAMSAGIAVIFAGVLLTRSPRRHRRTHERPPTDMAADESTAASIRRAGQEQAVAGEGLRFIADRLLPFDDADIADLCRRWSAAPIGGDVLTREQAMQTWALRVSLAGEARDRFDRLPLGVQGQLGELYRHVWVDDNPQRRPEMGAESRRSLAILRPASEAEGEAR
jgi:hypothetical protein